jgi:hypothetical protein
MRLVVHQQRVLTEEPGMQRPQPEPDAVSVEKQAAPDHIHGADDDRRTGRIGRPLAIIGELAPKRADRQRAEFQ